MKLWICGIFVLIVQYIVMLRKVAGIKYSVFVGWII